MASLPLTLSRSERYSTSNLATVWCDPLDSEGSFPWLYVVVVNFSFFPSIYLKGRGGKKRRNYWDFSMFLWRRWIMSIATCRRRCHVSFIWYFSSSPLPWLCVWLFSWHVCSELDGWLQGIRVRDVRGRRVGGQSAGLGSTRARWQEDRPQSCIPSPSSP